MRTLFTIAFVLGSLGACVIEDDTQPLPPVDQEEDASDDDRIPIDPPSDLPTPTDGETTCLSAQGKKDSGCAP